MARGSPDCDAAASQSSVPSIRYLSCPQQRRRFMGHWFPVARLSESLRHHLAIEPMQAAARRPLMGWDTGDSISGCP